MSRQYDLFGFLLNRRCISPCKSATVILGTSHIRSHRSLDVNSVTLYISPASDIDSHWLLLGVAFDRRLIVDKINENICKLR
jgi:hypothetical protein